MDSVKLVVKGVIVLGLATVWPGPWILSQAFAVFGPPGPSSLAGRPPMASSSSRGGPPSSAAAWFQEAKGSCNPVEVKNYLRVHPAPQDFDGTAYTSACLALAGQIDEARATIQALPQDQQWQAAGVVFQAGHPVADAGDDLAAGPLMEVVVEFWPNHYQALYHAGAARYQKGDLAAAQGYLERFLQYYHTNDGWTRSARDMLAAIGESQAAPPR